MICDTGALLAAFAPDQRGHPECAAVLADSQQRLVPPMVLAEIDGLARRHLGAAAALRIAQELIGPSYRVMALTPETMAIATEVMSASGLDLVDASLVAHAREMKTLDLFTLDRGHFRRVRALNGLPFRLLPFDLDL